MAVRAPFRSSRRLLAAVLVVAPVGLFAACSGGEESSGPPLTGPAAEGQQLFKSNGCAACHSVDGSKGVGPTMQGLAGSQVALEDGTTVTADDAYLRESILEPSAKRVAGYSAAMPARDLSPAEVDALVAYIDALR